MERRPEYRQEASLGTYADGASTKPKLYAKTEKHPMDGSASLSEEKIERPEAEVEKWILSESCTSRKIGSIYESSTTAAQKDLDHQGDVGQSPIQIYCRQLVFQVADSQSISYQRPVTLPAKTCLLLD